jgi:hypothetical protein
MRGRQRAGFTSVEFAVELLGAVLTSRVGRSGCGGPLTLESRLRGSLIGKVAMFLATSKLHNPDLRSGRLLAAHITANIKTRNSTVKQFIARIADHVISNGTDVGV